MDFTCSSWDHAKVKAVWSMKNLQACCQPDAIPKQKRRWKKSNRLVNEDFTGSSYKACKIPANSCKYMLCMARWWRWCASLKDSSHNLSWNHEWSLLPVFSGITRAPSVHKFVKPWMIIGRSWGRARIVYCIAMYIFF